MAESGTRWCRETHFSPAITEGAGRRLMSPRLEYGSSRAQRRPVSSEPQTCLSAHVHTSPHRHGQEHGLTHSSLLISQHAWPIPADVYQAFAKARPSSTISRLLLSGPIPSMVLTRRHGETPKDQEEPWPEVGVGGDTYSSLGSSKNRG